METVRFGVIGLGLMGREIASASARMFHLPDLGFKYEITGICDKNLHKEKVQWFTDNFRTINVVSEDYKDIIDSPDIDAVYCAVPHYLHEEFYCKIIESGKALLGEKPFGINLEANTSIINKIKEYPNSFVRCSSEFPFFPAVQRICELIEEEAFGSIIDVECGFLHSSDIDPNKPINWKRMVEYNGEYGCMGDLGMHVCHVPFRAGWISQNVRAVLSNIITERPDSTGDIVECNTYDNAHLLCETVDIKSGDTFPMTIKTYRISPGEKNTWYISILGTKTSVRFSTKNPKTLQLLEYSKGNQVWQNIDMGQETAFKTITGGIFEFGFSDSILQMLAAFLYEKKHGKPLKKFAGCVTPEETALSHKLFTAALESHKNKSVVSIMS